MAHSESPYSCYTYRRDIEDRRKNAEYQHKIQYKMKLLQHETLLPYGQYCCILTYVNKVYEGLVSGHETDAVVPVVLVLR